jgi:hypothetical protein
MKTLKNHTILYDEVCPMCNLYTKAFVKTGMLDKEGREPYQNISYAYATNVDAERAVNEIALVNRETGEIEYGIKSLFTIIGNSFPVFKPLFLVKPFAWLMDKFYKFISYNRRVIMPSAKEKTGSMNHPSFNLRFRIAYLIFTWLTTAFILYNYSKLLTEIIPSSDFYREFLICGGQIFWQLCFVSFTNKNKVWDYLGTMMTISFAGALLLLIGIVVAKFLSAASIVFAVYFTIVATLMLLEHIRRVKVLQLSPVLSFTWVFYRLILLIVILYA